MVSMGLMALDGVEECWQEMRMTVSVTDATTRRMSGVRFMSFTLGVHCNVFVRARRKYGRKDAKSAKSLLIREGNSHEDRVKGLRAVEVAEAIAGGQGGGAEVD